MFCLVGKVQNAGLVEVPMGMMTIDEIVNGIGGGAADGHTIKAVQTVGSSGVCIPTDLFNTPVDFNSLKNIRTIMGSGGLVVMDESDCIVDIDKFFMKFTMDESCGKCTPCRVGNMRVLELLEKITTGQGTTEDLKRLEKLCYIITESSLCGLGKTATTPVKSSMHYFESEYLDHVQEPKCVASVCRELLNYIVTDRCVGCGVCIKKCLVEAISGERRKTHNIDVENCIKCNACLEACPVSAIEIK